MRNPEVRTLALELLTSNERTQATRLGAIRLLRTGYIPGDAAMIESALAELGPPDTNTQHNIGFDIRDIAKANDTADLTPLLMWLYNNTPCTNCRYSAVKHLAQHNTLPRTTAQECLHDACEDIRNAAQAYLTEDDSAPA